MKTCPNCKMTVDSYGECAVCGFNIADEPYVEDKGEKYVFNKFFIRHLFRKHKFPLISLVLVIIGVLICVPNMNERCFWLCVVSPIISAIGLYLFLYIKQSVCFAGKIFKEQILHNIESILKFLRYALSFLAIMVQFFAILISINPYLFVK